MNWKSFNHPDLNLKVIRRQAGAALIDFLAETGVVLMTRGRSLLWGQGFKIPTAYRMAMSRLRRAGLIAYRRTGGRDPVLQVTARGDEARTAITRPERFWQRKWKGIWYILSYDIPEKSRAYRDHLRWFLSNQRMGMLQHSLWVSPDDIRPEFHDLVQAAALDQYAFLFEARNVLGRSDREIAARAWSFDRLEKLQAWYLAVYEENFNRLIAQPHAPEEVFALGQESMSAFSTVMREDPLLPLALCPASYHGPQVIELHRRLLRAVGERL
jgi:phenylacetic acid degradation operon negative regulatory protein